jgi:hypothetical protein
MSDQYLSTIRLANVIRLIALGRQTGLLRVIRGQGPTREEGEIQFLDGQPVRATVGQLVGGAALAVLQNWGETYYVFLDGVNGMGSYPSDSLGWGPPPPSTGSLPPAGSGSLPLGTFGNSQPGPGYGGPPDYGQSPYSRGYPPGPVQNPYGPPTGPGARNPHTGGLPNLRQQVAQRLLDLSYIPRRLPMMEQSEPPMMDRRERQLLLLVDGRRTIADLVRLTRRSEEEIRAILAHLISQGLVE